MLRARLNKPASSEAAKAVLGKVFLETVARSGLDAPLPAAGEAFGAPAALIAEAHVADMAGLSACAGGSRNFVRPIRADTPRRWTPSCISPSSLGAWRSPGASRRRQETRPWRRDATS